MKAEDIIRSLIESDCGFKLCGSRALGTFTDKSDYDLFGPHSRTAHGRMIEHGFTRKKHAEYHGSHIYALYEKQADDGLLVQVAIEFDVVFRERIMRALRLSDELLKLDESLKKEKTKGKRDELWSALYVAAGFDPEEWDERTGERREKTKETLAEMLREF